MTGRTRGIGLLHPLSIKVERKGWRRHVCTNLGPNEDGRRG